MASTIPSQVPPRTLNSESIFSSKRKPDRLSSANGVTKLSSFRSLLHSCRTVDCAGFEARQIHGHMIVTGMDSQYHFLRTLFGIYARSGDLESCRQLFAGMPERDTFDWNLIIRSHFDRGDSVNALNLYQNMLLNGAHPDNYTFPCVLMSCVVMGSGFSLGKQIHAHIFKRGLSSDVYVGSSLMNMYGEFNRFSDAHRVFGCFLETNAVCWTTLAQLYVAEGRPKLALDVFHQMELECLEIDRAAAVTMIGACRQLRSIFSGRKVHEHIKRIGLESDLVVSNSLLRMYIDCQSISDARGLFDRIECKNVVSFTTLLGGYVQNGSYNEALKLFRKMQLEGVKPDALSISSVLPACARLTASSNGQEIHCYAIKNGFDVHLPLNNATMDMYVKSGRIDSATRLFARMGNKDVVSWTVMIAGYSLHGQGEVGIELFHEMQNTSVEPDQLTYAAVLYACCVAGRVEEGLKYFRCIVRPEVEHWACVVYLLSRGGRFGEACALIQNERVGKYAAVQRSLLNGCRIHRKQQLGRRTVQILTELEIENADNYVLFSNMYAAMGKTQLASKFRKLITDLGLKTRKANSWIKIRNKVHVFGVGDVSHPRSERIYIELQGLMTKMVEVGYMPTCDFSFHDVDEERESILIGHSEMLAIGLGLISTAEGITIHVTKNHRVCNDCHEMAKMASRLLSREIVLRDPQCFHHFKNGACSCGDFW